MAISNEKNMWNSTSTQLHTYANLWKDLALYEQNII